MLRLFGRHDTEIGTLVTAMRSLVPQTLQLGHRLVVTGRIGERSEHTVRYLFLHALDFRSSLGMLLDQRTDTILTGLVPIDGAFEVALRAGLQPC